MHTSLTIDDNPIAASTRELIPLVVVVVLVLILAPGGAVVLESLVSQRAWLVGRAKSGLFGKLTSKPAPAESLSRDEVELIVPVGVD